MTDLLAMAGHGAYVWSAYALSLLALIAIGVWPLATMRGAIRRARRRQAQLEQHDPAS